MMATARTDVTDNQQSIIEEAEFDGGVPVFADAKTRVVAKAADGSPYRTANAGTDIRSNAGVVMPHDDTPNRFYNEQAGKA